MAFKHLHYEEALDHLRVGYNRGLVVPFVGSGLSAPRLPLWPELVYSLAKIAGLDDLSLPERPSDQHLIIASERIVWSFRTQGISLAKAMMSIFQTAAHPGVGMPEATEALASVWWPLVLTTNYDTLFRDAFNQRHHRAKHDGDAIAAVGRSPADCHAVLASLGSPSRPLLWALQGFLDMGLHGDDLGEEIVLGYEQYRRASLENTGFRAAFTEVYRNRSLLFAGAGLGEEYFRSLFGESIVRLGTNQHAHSALVNAADLQSDAPWFMHTRMNIIMLTYSDEPGQPKYSGFAPCLRKIAAALNEPPRGAWRYTMRTRTNAPVTVEIEPTPLPRVLEKDHWVVGSAGKRRSEEVRVSGDLPQELLGHVVDVSNRQLIRRISDRPVLLAIARQREQASSRHRRDLRQVADTTLEALEVAVGAGAKRVSFMLLSASVHSGRWPRVFSLVEMLRGIRRFVESRHSSLETSLTIVIHDTAAGRDGEPDRSAWHAIESRRLDPSEVLDCKDLRFYVDVGIASAPTRTSLYLAEDKTVAQVAQYLQLKGNWIAKITPNPAPTEVRWLPSMDVSLLDAGVVPGATLSFRREASRGTTEAVLESATGMPTSWS
jgi:hypothetical protein